MLAKSIFQSVLTEFSYETGNLFPGLYGELSLNNLDRRNMSENENKLNLGDNARFRDVAGGDINNYYTSKGEEIPRFKPNSPYKGLKAFDSSDKDIFFGRDNFIETLADELEQTNLILLLGASGSGKSSVVRAGLIPELDEKYRNVLKKLIFIPDKDPFLSFHGGVATASRDNTARVWDAATGEELQTFPGHKDRVVSVVFSPDGKRVATASADSTARVWDAATGEELQTLQGHKNSVVSVVFSADGKRVATASLDNTARVWSTATGEVLQTLSGHESWVMSVVFSPDGERVATASDDNTARVWQVGDMEDMLAISCDWARHYLASKPEDDEDRHLCEGVGDK